MSVSIISGSTSDELEVDPVSKAAHVSIYYADGKHVFRRPQAEATIRIPFARMTAAVAAGSLIWGMRYTGPGVLRVRAGHINIGFDGTAAASSSQFQFVRFSGANIAGGTTISPVLADTSNVMPVIDARFNYAAALATTGATIGADFIAEYGCARQLSASQQFTLPSRQASHARFVDLRSGEGLAIRLGVVAVIGDVQGGFLELQEYETTE